MSEDITAKAVAEMRASAEYRTRGYEVLGGLRAMRKRAEWARDNEVCETAGLFDERGKYHADEYALMARAMEPADAIELAIRLALRQGIF